MLSFKERRQFRDKNQLEKTLNQTESKTRLPISYGSIISTVALLISAVSAYFANFYHHRSLHFEVAPSPPDTEVDFGVTTAQIDYTLVFWNNGTRPEVVLRTEIYIEEQFGGFRTYDPEGPFVIGPGDAISVPITGSLSFLNRLDNNKLDPEMKAGKVFVHVIALSPNGSEFGSVVPTITFSAQADSDPGASSPTVTLVMDKSKDYPRGPVDLVHGVSENAPPD